MELGFVSAILPDLSLEEVVQFAGAEDFDCVERDLQNPTPLEFVD